MAKKGRRNAQKPKLQEGSPRGVKDEPVDVRSTSSPAVKKTRAPHKSIVTEQDKNENADGNADATSPPRKKASRKIAAARKLKHVGGSADEEIEDLVEPTAEVAVNSNPIKSAQDPDRNIGNGDDAGKLVAEKKKSSKKGANKAAIKMNAHSKVCFGSLFFLSGMKADSGQPAVIANPAEKYVSLIWSTLLSIPY